MLMNEQQASEWFNGFKTDYQCITISIINQVATIIAKFSKVAWGVKAMMTDIIPSPGLELFSVLN